MGEQCRYNLRHVGTSHFPQGWAQLDGLLSPDLSALWGSEASLGPWVSRHRLRNSPSKGGSPWCLDP